MKHTLRYNGYVILLGEYPEKGMKYMAMLEEYDGEDLIFGNNIESCIDQIDALEE